MKITINKSNICGQITVPASKSVAHRVLICAVLSGKFVEIRGRIGGKDVETTIHCLAKIAKEIYKDLQLKNVLNTLKLIAQNMDGEWHNDEFDYIVPNGKQNGYITLDASESGSSLRFLLPIVAVLGIKTIFVGKGRLAHRPIGGLVDTLNTHGANIKGNALPICVCGKAEGNVYEIDSSISSQYVSGMLLALSCKNQNSMILCDGKPVSKGYIDITIDTLKKFGIEVKNIDSGYTIKGAILNAPKKIYIDGDWSSASILMVASALLGDLKIKGLSLTATQGDKIVLQLLRQAGARIVIDADGVEVKKSKLHAINFDAIDCPDVVPIMSVALASASGTSNIFGVERLRDKESDRIEAILQMLKKFNINAKFENNVLSIVGGKLNAQSFCAYNDHRIAMSEIVGAMCADGQSEVDDVACIAKSYPDFVEDIKSVGGQLL